MPQTTSTVPATAQWLVFIASLPTEDPAARMRVLRTLESLGTAVVREGTYLLPQTPTNQQALEKLAAYVSRNTGVAHVLHVVSASSGQSESFKHLFDRASRYEALIKDIEALKVGFGITDPSAIARVLLKLRRDFETISALDFFPSDARARAQAAFTEAESAVKARMFPGGTDIDTRTVNATLARTWATRKPAWADRLACAWLIRRFIDPEASIIWLDTGQAPPAGASGFAFEGAQYTLSETKVTFEQMLVRFGLESKHALVRVGAIVHYLEVGGTPVPEAAGVETLLQGASRRSSTDDELLRESEKTFDLLYEAYLEASPRAGRRKP